MNNPTTPSLPLQGVKVLDLSRVMAGPFATQALGDLGADIIKVEHPERGDDTRDWGQSTGRTSTTYYNSANRNKRSIAIDLKTDKGRDLTLALAKQCDVVVHNFRHGGIERLGLDYAAIKAIKPDIIYCSITGYSADGPEASRPGYDLVVQGETGLMALNGEAGQSPLKFGVAVVDMFTGMSAAQAILAALFNRQCTQEGCHIEMCLFDSGITVQSYYGLEALQLGQDPDKVGNEHPTVVPYGVFEAKDGSLAIAVGNNAQFKRFCQEVIQRPDLAQDPDFATNQLRSTHRDKLMPTIKAAIKQQPRQTLLTRLHELKIPCGEVLGMNEALQSQRSQHAGMVVSYSSDQNTPAYCLAAPYRFNGQRVPTRYTPPELAENTQEILVETLGLTTTEIQALMQEKVIK